MAIFLPNHSLQGPRIKAPPTAPRGMAELTRLFCSVVRWRSTGRYRLAPEMSDWSSPERRPPMEANATMTHVKCLGSVNCRWKKPVLRPPSASSSASISPIRASISYPPACATARACASSMAGMLLALTGFSSCASWSFFLLMVGSTGAGDTESAMAGRECRWGICLTRPY